MCTSITHTAFVFLACSFTSSQQEAPYHYIVWNCASERLFKEVNRDKAFSPSVCGTN